MEVEAPFPFLIKNSIMAQKKTAKAPVVEAPAPEVENPTQGTEVVETEKVEAATVETEKAEVEKVETEKVETEEAEAKQEETEKVETEEQPAPEAPAPEVENPVPAKEAKASKKSKVVTETVAEIDELPDYAKRVLKLFDNEPYLYVSSKGGAFKPGTKPSERGEAILYKNPFYKS